VTLLVDGEKTDVDFADDFEAFKAYWSDERHGMMGWGQTATFFRDGAAFVTSSFRTDGVGAGLASNGTILSPMPGRIIAVDVTQGQSVTKGQKLLTLEAMKMEHSLVAPFNGVVAELNAAVGGQVQVEALLVRVEAVGE
jgi:3-methylcrotonyl-CoA carboxylase alpha subunit